MFRKTWEAMNWQQYWISLDMILCAEEQVVKENKF